MTRKKRKPRFERRRVYLCVESTDGYVGSDNWADSESHAIRRAVDSKHQLHIDKVCAAVEDYKIREEVRTTLIAQHWAKMRKEGWTMLRGRLTLCRPRSRGVSS